MTAGAKGRPRPLWRCPRCGHHAVVHASYVDGALWMRRPVRHPLLRRTEDFGRLGFVHHFRLERPKDVDASLNALMREAYRVGTQEA